jgi:hypothetical protein
MVMQFTDKEYRLAREGAKDASSSSRTNSLVEQEDLVGEAYLWLAGHPKKVVEWRELGRKGENMLRISCKRAALKAVAKERKRRTGAEYSDMCFYSTQMIRELMPTIFNAEDWVNSAGAMSNEPKSQAAPAEGNNKLAMIVDVRGAYHDQAKHIQEFLQRMYDDPVPNVEDLIAVEEGVSTKTIQRRDERYLGFMVQYLGGDNPWEKAE